LVVVFFVVILISFLMPVFGLLILCMVSDVAGKVCLICGQFLRPSICRSASLKVMPGVVSLSVTSLAGVSSVLL
jgi:hypothetical protein